MGLFDFVKGAPTALKPSFLIIGAQKSGTSALFGMLAEHAQLEAPEVKELHFFDRYKEYEGGVEAYWEKFPKGRKGTFTFEATPDYIWNPKAAERIHAHLPQAKLILVLREPVGRAFSAWNMFRDFKDSPRFGDLHDSRSFEEAVSDELAGKTTRKAHRYLARGYYADQVKEYLKYFDKQNILIIGYSSFQKHPAKVVNGVLRFLDLPAMDGSDPIFKVRKNQRPYVTALSDDIKKQLEEHFKPFDKKLVEMLGTHFEY